MTFSNDILLVASVFFACFISCDSQMRSPCPDYFEYSQDSSGNVIGLIRIAPGRQIDEIITTVRYALAVTPPTSYLGNVKPLTTLQDYNNGQTLVYQVNFPVNNPVPEITNININGQDVCRASALREVTSITQTHKMKVTRTFSVQSNFENRPMTVNNFNDRFPSHNFPTSNFPSSNFPSSDFPSSNFPSSDFPSSNFPSSDFPSINTDLFTGTGTTGNNFSSLLDKFGGKIPELNQILEKFGKNNNTQIFIQSNTTPNRGQFAQRPPVNSDAYPVIRPRPTVRPQQEYVPPQTTQARPAPVRTTPRPQPRPTEPPRPVMNRPRPVTNRPRPVTNPPQPVTNPPTTTPAATPQPSTPFPKDCGLRGDASVALIFYGEGYSRGDWPWLVAMYRKVGVNTVFTCAGVLVTSINVITAAHCMRNQQSTFAQDDIFLKIGAYNLDVWSDRYMEIRSLSSALIHDDFDTATLANDILVMTLDREVQFNPYIRPVCLWKGSSNIEEIVGKRGYVAGWGKSELGGAGVGEPRVLQLPIVSTTKCRGVRPDFFKLTSEKTLCAGDRNGSGPCTGDSGGGLYIHREGRWQLRGIVSLSLPDNTGQERQCNPDEYAVFTDIAQYMPWIINAIAPYYLK